ncbi:hypothetical protein [Glycomyces terrestris]|uniref:Secreted protein n=1 Tax=Glycomyces terrestris TaxID=2493553 RepID=A0A426V439_9ACTN|nr:hypothetical protein [Glycomyces terrestris]RRS01605.1 hypothetical protein EIW28_02215 [Glycomyces terrestris]
MKNALPRLRSALRGTALASAATAVAVLAVQSPVLADEQYLGICDDAGVSCQTGVQVASPQGECEMAPSQYASTYVCVAYDGDFVYVKDNDADGRAAMAYVWSEEGATDSRLCRNNLGSGTWARCDFDWVESGRHSVEGGYKTSTVLNTTPLWSWSGK